MPDFFTPAQQFDLYGPQSGQQTFNYAPGATTFTPSSAAILGTAGGGDSSGGIGSFLNGIFGGGGSTPDATGGAGFGLNTGTGRGVLGALGTAGNLWQSWNANQLAQKTFNFQRNLANTNLTNSIRAYNTQLEDRARSRAVVEGQTDQQRQDYIDRNRLTR